MRSINRVIHGFKYSIRMHTLIRQLPAVVSEIFRNLISNATKYRRPDSDDSEIIIKINVDHLCADILFADNGIGIRDSSLKRIFEMFYPATNQGDGSGIGLYIVKYGRKAWGSDQGRKQTRRRNTVSYSFA